MIVLSFLVTILLVGGIATAAVLLVRGSQQRTEAPSPGLPAPAREAELSTMVAAGLIAPEQRAAILAWETQPQPTTQSAPSTAAPSTPAPSTPAPAQPPRRSVVAESLGYLGGMLAVGGMILLVGRSWSDLSTVGRAALSGGAAVLLLAAGLLMREATDLRLRRLRSLLWFAAGGATAVLAVVLVHDGAGVGSPRTSVPAAAAAVLLLNGTLWRWRPDPLQQLTAAAAAVVATGGAAAHLANAQGMGGLGALTASLVLLTLCLRNVLDWPAATEVVGAAGGLVGASMVATQWPGAGLPLLLVVTGSIVGITLVPRIVARSDERTVLAVIGSIGLLQAIPATLGHFTPGAAAVTGAVTYLLGVGLLTVGLRQWGRAPDVLLVVGSAGLLGGAALTFHDWHGVAPILGIVTATGLLALGARPRGLLLSVLGAIGLLANVPWLVSWYFPGQGRAPVIVVLTGLVLVGVATLLSRSHSASWPRIGHPRHP